MPVDAEPLFRLLVLFGPAMALTLLGLWLALGSGGTVASSPDRGRLLAANASHLLVRLGLWVAGLAAVAEMVGMRTFLQSI
jgi:hypothetical protein